MPHGKHSFRRTCLPCRLSTLPPLDSRAREIEMDVHTKTCTWMNIIHNSPQTGNKPNLHQQVRDNVQHIHPGITAQQGKGSTSSIPLGIILLGERNQPSRATCCTWSTKKNRPRTAWNLGKEELTAKEHERTFWNHGDFLSCVLNVMMIHAYTSARFHHSG